MYNIYYIIKNIKFKNNFFPAQSTDIFNKAQKN